jgi:indolepyruvate ferredoxin oxidoreductase beta subunit
MEQRRITIAVLALGGQGGGVFADWLVTLAERNGYFAQATSIPGVAQRTGSTVYYLELYPEEDLRGRQPVLALMPAPSDVDVVVAAELMEAGRAILRGLVTRERTALITSTHRIYAISEKSAISGSIGDSTKVIEAAAKSAKSLTAFDMDAAAERTESAISAVMLGAVAQSGALPFLRQQFEDAIRANAVAVEANLAGFAAGYDAASRGIECKAQPVFAPPEPTTQRGRALRDRARDELPDAAQAFALEGVRRLMDYQDADYAALYLDRLGAIKALDADDWVLTRETARALALWMSYEDVMRVAQQKVSAARMEKVLAEVNARPDQILHVIEYMHPRWQELCDTLPAGLGVRLESSRLLRRILARFFKKGRHVRTTGVFWFIALALLASRRRARRGTLRYRRENGRIETWLAMLADAAIADRTAAVELARCQNLVKGYSATHERGLRKFDVVIDAWRRMRDVPDIAQILGKLREAALNDESGDQLEKLVSMYGQRSIDN